MTLRAFFIPPSQLRLFPGSAEPQLGTKNGKRAEHCTAGLILPGKTSQKFKK